MSDESTALTIQPTGWEPGIIDVERQKAIQANYEAFRAAVLKPGIHYGKMPGVNRDFLHQPGAEAFYKAIGCRPRYEILDKEIDRATEYCYFLVKAEVVEIGGTEMVVGEATGACSSLEFDEKCPVRRPIQQGDQFQIECAEHGAGQGKRGWEWGQAKGEKNFYVECRGRTPQSLARTLHNVQSRANKRAMIAAIRTVGAISEMFTQDEDQMDRRSYQPPPADGETQARKPQSRSGQGTRASTRTAAAKKEEAPQEPSGPDPEGPMDKEFQDATRQGFALIKDAGVSKEELQGWAENKGLLKEGEKLTARIVWRFACGLKPLPSSNESAVGSFVAAVLEVLKPAEEEAEFVEGEVMDDGDEY